MIAGCRLAVPLMMLAAIADASPTGEFTVSATITAGCLVNQQLPPNGAVLGAIGSLDFGTASALSRETRTAALLTSATFRLSCTPGVPLTMRIDGGRQPDGERRLAHENVSETLAYRLYRDATLQATIGIDQPVAVDTSSNPDDIVLPVWGSLDLPGNLPAGLYHDTLTITIEW